MESTIISKYTGKTLCHLEEISADNLRSGMPKEGWLCRYNLSKYGWLGQRCFSNYAEASAFAEGIKAQEISTL